MQRFRWWDENIHESVIVYDPCNIYGGTKLGRGCKVGAQTEISGAVIGNYVTIGAMCFIPKGVEVRDSAWIGPRVTFCNDRLPPSCEEKWESVVVESGAVIGAGTIVLPGVVIGERSVIGAGSVVTKSVPAEEVWAGNPAKFIRRLI